METKSITQPDETRKFAAHGWVDVVNLQGMSFGKATFQPGWRWSEDVKPIAGTDLCQVAHKAFVVSGRMHVVLADGTEGDLGPGDVFVLEPGHDAWTVGDEDCVMYDFSTGIDDYAKPAS